VSRQRHTDAQETSRGASLVGLLVTLLVLGGAAVGAFEITSGSNNSVLHPTLPGSSPNAVSSPGGVIDSAAVVTCRTDYLAVQTADGEYQSVQEQPATNMSELQPMIRDNLSSPYFSFGIDAKGRVTVATPGHPAAPGDANCAYAR
jgi:hypothetical protein